jgi:hypothetical protein
MTREGLSAVLEGASGSTIALLAGGAVIALLVLVAVVMAVTDKGGGSYELSPIEYVNGRQVTWSPTPEDEALGRDMFRSLRADGRREGGVR